MLFGTRAALENRLATTIIATVHLPTRMCPVKFREP